MTTLPQTTSARFPRVGGRAPSIPALAQANAGGAAGASTSGLTMADVFRVLRANAWLIILCTLVALILGFVVNNYVLLPYFKKYTARTVLQVQLPSIIDPTAPIGGGSIEQVVLEVRQKTLSQKLSSPDLWRSIFQVDKGGVPSLPWMQHFKDPSGALDQARATEAVSSALRVNPTPQTELISVELSAPSPADAKFVLEAIIGKLIASEQTLASSSSSDDRNALRQYSQRISTQIAGLEQSISASSAILNTERGADGQGNGLAIARNMELQNQVNERIKKQTDYNKAQGEYDGFVKSLDAGGTPPMIDRAIEENPSVQRMTEELESSQTYLQTLRTQYSDSHKEVKRAEANVDAQKAALEQKRESLRVSLGAQYRDMLQTEAAQAKSDLEDSNKTIAGLEKTIGELNAEQLKFSSNKDQKDYLDRQKQTVDQRLQILDANALRQSDDRGSVRQLYPVEEPKSLSFPDLKVTLVGFAILGLGLSLGIAFLRELMDTSVRSPRDIARVGQINLLGMIPHTDDDPQAANGEISLIISQEPHSIIAENFRQVRTRLQHTASLDTTRSMLVTSPGPGDGKTTIACNIAAGLALNGRKILLVDANFRRPALHTVFGVNNEAGLGSVLAQSTPASSVIHKTSVPNLDVLTTGPRPANTTELLESQLLTDFIDRSLEEYDHVIFDAGPILLVSETVALAPRVDGVITVVRARANSRGLLTRMRDALRQLKAEHLGVVLNGVRQHSGGYYRRNIKNYYAYQNGQD